MIPIPDKKFVDARGGVFFGHFSRRMSPTEQAEYESFVTPLGHERHEFLVGDRVIVFSLPKQERRIA